MLYLIRVASTCTCLLALALLIVTDARADLITNGSFESGLTGWTVTDGSVEVIDSSVWPAAVGNLSIDLNGSHPGTIVQHVTGLTVGQTYDLKFALAGNPYVGRDDVGSADNVKQLLVSAGGNNLEYFLFDVAPYHTDVGSDPNVLNPVTNMGWQETVFRFHSDSTAADISFQSYDRFESTRGPALDNIRLEAVTTSAVPEPSALALAAFAFPFVVALKRKNFERRRGAILQD